MPFHQLMKNKFLGFFLLIYMSGGTAAYGQLSREPEFTSPAQKENLVEWNLLQTLKDTLLPAYIPPQTEEQVQHWLGEVHKFNSEFSQANDDILKMDQATRAHDVETANAEAKAAADILNRISWKPYAGSDQFNDTQDQTGGQNTTLIAEVDKTLDRATGLLTVTDVDTHRSVTLTVRSGNSPYGIGFPGGQGADGRYDNVPDRGPIPKGDYRIGNGYQEPHITQLHPGGDAKWYHLYGSDGHGGYSYEKIWNGRGYLNLHTGLASDGCVTVPSEVPLTDSSYPNSSKYDQLKDLLDNTKLFEYKPNDTYRGWLHVK